VRSASADHLPDRDREEYRRINEGFKELREERKLKDEQEKAFAEASLRDQEREVALKEAEEESRLQEQVRPAQQIRFLPEGKSDFQVEEAKRCSKVEAREAEEVRKAREVREAELTLPAEPPVDSAAPLANIRCATLGQI
jgi:hypothetical protein